MRYLEAHQKPLIDLTAFDQDDWREDMEAEIARLNDMIITLLYRRTVQ